MKEKVKTDLDYYNNLPYTITLERWDEPDNVYWVARVFSGRRPGGDQGSKTRMVGDKPEAG